MKKAILAWCFQYATAIGVMFLLAAIWHALVVLRGIEPIILPTPLRVLEAAIRERETLFKGFLATGMAASLGLTLSIALGSLIAIVFSQSKTLRSAFYPYVLFLQTVPIVAIAPLLITWCGYGAHTVVLVAAIISIFPIVSNVTAGLISVDENLKDLFELHQATRWQTLIKLRIPNAIGSLILGMRVSTGLAVIGAVVGEFFLGTGVAGYSGLGTVMIIWQNRSRTDALIAVVFVSTLLGLAMLGAVNLGTRLLLRRWTVGQNFENE
ncbi:ABC transporter permease [Aureliella helgolandensis]|uniref:Aliphatic sulfonates transport permease protein SsuC n=1 Tax=Aureliella helgolandensis TaxID=2527968 RepID=A0A518G9Y2_9BACT|nr:ABC transporter permease [Aureliella helgolandensis]QDV25396.1 Putative aliphatic sulfonates transport permease protein SsuC [Aureliella helgolandensis]